MSYTNFSPPNKPSFYIYLTRIFHPFYFRFHESPSGENTLLKTGRNATEPYFHTINEALDIHQGRYYCRIENVMGINECSAFLIIRNSASKTISALGPILALGLNLLVSLVWWYSVYMNNPMIIRWNSASKTLTFPVSPWAFGPWAIGPWAYGPRAEIHSIPCGDISYMKKLCCIKNIRHSQTQLRCPSQQFLP